MHFSRFNHFFLLLFSFFSLSYINAQGLKDVLKENSNEKWFYFQEEAQINENAFLVLLKEEYPELRNSVFKERKRTTDDYGNTHLKYTQSHLGIPVYATDLQLHKNGNGIYLANGRIAKNFIPAKSQMELSEILTRLDTDCKVVPDSDQMLLWVNSDRNQEYHLCYQIHTQCENKMDDKILFLDAGNGEMIREFEMSANCNSKTAKTLLPFNSGIQEFNVTPRNGFFHLLDECRSDSINPIVTMRGFGANPVDSIKSDDNTWHSGILPSAAQAHWGTSRYYDFLRDEFSRNSWDDQGARMMNVLDSTQGNGAGFIFNGNYSLHGKDLNTAHEYWTSLDIIGHEWTHPIIFYEGILLWNFEGNAIAEGVCDVFGVLHEKYTVDKYDSLKNSNWLIAEQHSIGPLRDLSNPGNFGMTDTYNSSLYLNASNKYARSSAFSYWFYLLSNGGTGTNDHNSQTYSYNVQSLGFKKSAAILYHSMLNYLGPQSGYLDMRYATQQAAEDIFGQCSFEFKNVVETWKAVGVYDSLNYCNPISLINNNLTQEIKVYPNPASDILKIEILNESIQKAEFTIYDLQGKKMIQRPFENKSQIVDLKDFRSGVYLYEINLNEEVLTNKLYLQK